MGNFAFGRDVLPVDTNVQRVQERTGELFHGSPAPRRSSISGQPSASPASPVATAARSRPPARRAGRRFEPLRKQSQFERPFRQRRAVALRAVAAGEHPTDGEALVSLQRDGPVVLRDGTVSLPPLAERQERALVLEEEALQLEAAPETRERAV